MRITRALGLGTILAALLAVPFALAAEAVKVRVGEHPGFDRLVFDWAKPAGAELVSAPGQVRLIFDRVGDFDLSLVRKDPPPSVRGVTVGKGAQERSITIEIAPGATASIWESGASTVLDIRHENTAVETPPPQAVKPDLNEKTAAPVSRSAAPAPVPAPPAGKAPAAKVISPPTPLTAPPKAPPAAVQAKPENQESASPAFVAAPSAKAAAPLSLLEAPPRPEAAKPKKPQLAGKTPPPARVKPKQAAPKPKTVSKPSKKPPVKAAAAPAAADPGRRGRLVVVADQGPSLLDSTAINFFDGVPQTMNNLRFQWDAETALAVFRRGPHLWLVFDREVLGDATEGLADLAPELAPIEQFAAPDATLIRLTPPPIMEPKISRDGNAWVIELWPRPPRTVLPVDIALEGDPAVSRIDFAIQSPGRPISFQDPDSGAAMVVIPSSMAEQGLAVAQTFPQFRALRSLQGLVIVLADSALRVELAGAGVRITHPDGLIVSKGATLALLKSNDRRPAVGPRLLDLSAWRRSKNGGFATVRRDLQTALSQADRSRRSFARLDLARLYFAHGFAAEAAGLLSVGAALDADLPIDPETRLMRGVSAFLGGDYSGAAKDLFHPSLNGEAEAELWNGAMAAVGYDWDVAAGKFAETKHLIADYPHHVRMLLWLTAAEAEMAVNNLGAAEDYLTSALSDDPNRDEESQIAVLTGFSKLKKDKKEEARSLWQSVVAFSTHPPSRTRARLALLDLAVAEKSVTADEAIAELERLRFSWRGDSIEIALLQRLGDLYLSQGQYRASLRAFRQATVNVPSSRFARDVAARMRDVFFDIIAGEEGKDFPPLSALALYEEFKELSPPSTKGDLMLDRLADRLVEVDLLPRAAELLTAQIKFRLSGETKAKTGARVAALHLLDDLPEKAIAVLGLSEEAGLSQDLKQRRLYLRARALSRLARYDEAMKLLGGDPFPEALRLRADILWVQANWRAAAVILKQLVPENPRADQTITNEDSRNVADLAIALTLSGEDSELAALGKVYQDAMAAGPDRDTFALLTDGAADEAGRSIAEQLASVKKAEDFMIDYLSRNQAAQAN